MSLLHRDEPPEAGVNDALTVEGHWLGGQFRGAISIPFRHCLTVLQHRRANAAEGERAGTALFAVSVRSTDAQALYYQGRAAGPRQAQGETPHEEDKHQEAFAVEGDPRIPR